MKTFVCKNTDGAVYHLPDEGVLNIKPTIARNGDAILIVNYSDSERHLLHTIYCDRIDTITKTTEE